MATPNGSVPRGVLPLELRRLIYHDVFQLTRPVLRQLYELQELSRKSNPTAHPIQKDREADQAPKPIGKDLLLVNRTVHLDAVSVLYEISTVHHSLNSLYDHAYITNIMTGHLFPRNNARSSNLIGRRDLRFMVRISLDYCTMRRPRYMDRLEDGIYNDGKRDAIYYNVDEEISYVLHALYHSATSLRVLSLTTLLDGDDLPHTRPIPLGGKIGTVLGALLPRLDELHYYTFTDGFTGRAIVERLVAGATWTCTKETLALYNGYQWSDDVTYSADNVRDIPTSILDRYQLKEKRVQAFFPAHVHPDIGMAVKDAMERYAIKKKKKWFETLALRHYITGKNFYPSDSTSEGRRCQDRHDHSLSRSKTVEGQAQSNEIASSKRDISTEHDAKLWHDPDLSYVANPTFRGDGTFCGVGFHPPIESLRSTRSRHRRCIA